MELLIDPTAPGYPAEYLAARIRGRSSGFTDWRGFIAGTASAVGQEGQEQDSFTTTVRWCFWQMERPLRQIFAPLLFGLEIRTVIFCLRFKKRGDFAEGQELLRQSLLHPRLLQTLQGEEPLHKTLIDLATTLASADRHFAALSPIANDEDALALFEQRLLVATLSFLAALSLPPLLNKFIRYLVDCRNLLAVSKFLRWREDKRPLLAVGGFISPAKLHRAESETALPRLAGAAGYGCDEKSRPDRLETIFLRFISQKLRLHRLSNDPVGGILLFLWQAYLEQRNRSLLFHGRRLDRILLLEEILY